MKLLKPISFLLLCVLVLYSTGYYFAYQVKLGEVKEEGFARAHSDVAVNVVTISSQYIKGEILNKDIELVEENEISYQGRMYDIISSTTEGNTITFQCVSDTKEDEVNTAWMDHVKQKSEPDGTHSTAFKPFTVYLDEHSAVTFPVFAITRELLSPAPNTRIQEAYLNIPSPPPWAFTV